GDRISGYWMHRVHPHDWPVEFEAWRVEGARDRSRPGLWFQITYTNLTADGGTEPGAYMSEFRIEGDDVVFEAEWNGTFRFVMDTTSVLYLDGNNQLTTVQEHVARPHLSDSSIRSQSDETSSYVRDTNRAMLHPNEVALLESVVSVVAARLAQRRYAPDPVIQGNIDIAMCNEFRTAYEYFYSNAFGIDPPPDAPDDRRGQPLALLARNWLRYKLQTTADNIELWTELKQSLRSMPCSHIVDALGLSAGELAVDDGNNRYEWKMRSLPLKAANVKDVFKELGKNLLEIDREVIRAAGRLGARIVGMLDTVDAIADVTFEPVEAFFKKTAGPADPPWPSPIVDDPATPADESERGSFPMYGIVIGGSYGLQFGVTVSFDYDWSSISMLDDRWSPDDFAGLFASQGIDVGWSPPGAFVEQIRRYWLGQGLLRTSGNLGVTVFSSLSTGWPRHAWSASPTWTNAQGAFVDLSYGMTYGYLCSDVSLTDPQSWENCITSAIQTIRPPVAPDEADVPLMEWDYVCFETGRSELTAEGELALRTAITENLPVLMQTLTSLRVEGYASPNGRDLFNETLSQHRARNVLRYIQSYLGPRLRIRPSHVSVIGYGHQPAIDAGIPYGTDSPIWRRVDLRINGRIVMRLPTGSGAG
ncbi:MAG: OmpA family protein, partial [Acidimicrobiia bacterium]|nr:OmpA family protein [Acidimicrobiia bacterium]